MRQASTVELLAARFGLLAFLGSVLAHAHALTWTASLADPWKPHLGVGLLVCGLLSVRYQPALTVLMVAAGVLDLIGAAPLFAPRDAEGGTHAARVVVFNVEQDDGDPAVAVPWLAQSGADVMVLVEVDDRWAAALHAVDLPHRIVTPDDRRFGAAVLSRWPLRRVDSDLYHGGGRTLTVEVAAPGGPLRVLAVHAQPPLGPDAVKARAAHVAHLAELLPEKGPAIVAGDLNLPPWSPEFNDLVGRTRLRDSGRGFGWQPTWPGRAALVGIPIDHVLVTPEIRVRDRRVGPWLESDHLPLVVDLGW